MLLIDEILISDDIIESQFICDLDACKGACCINGEGGAPLEKAELTILLDIYEKIEPYLTPEGKKAIGQQGLFVRTAESNFSEYATPLVDNKACAYLSYDDDGIAMCGIQKAYEAKEVDWPKPISCHLYPIRINKNEFFEAINYDRWDICKAACTLGEKESVYLYEFLKEPLIRKYGAAFYEQLLAAVAYTKE